MNGLGSNPTPQHNNTRINSDITTHTQQSEHTIENGFSENALLVGFEVASIRGARVQERGELVEEIRKLAARGDACNATQHTRWCQALEQDGRQNAETVKSRRQTNEELWTMKLRNVVMYMVATIRLDNHEAQRKRTQRQNFANYRTSNTTRSRGA